MVEEKGRFNNHYKLFYHSLTSLYTITPTRGDRNELLNFTVSRIPASIPGEVVNFAPKNSNIDLVARVKQGVENAKEKGYEYVLIVEDDDMYPVEYFETIDFEGFDFFGYSSTHYYNLKNRTYQTFYHQGRSSLFCTGFKISALENFPWPNDNWTFLDIRLWDFAVRRDKKIKLLSDNPCLGMKHGIGKCAGKGHTMTLANNDPELEWLESFVDEDAFKFYKGLSERL